MSKGQIIRRINLHLLLIVLIIFCIFEYGIQKICGFTLYPDEFGYWANAASVVGYDWSEVASLGSYYSFGYSLILIPILQIFSGGIKAYRAAVFINMFLICIGVFLLGKLIERIFPETETGTKVLVSGAAALYPAWIFYMQMTMVEALLMFVFTLDIYLFCRFMERQKLSTVIALAVLLIYGYSVHMRTVGVVIACVLVCLYRLVREKEGKKILLIWFGALALLCGIVFFIKEHTITTVYTYADVSTLAWNDYTGQLGKITTIFTFTGMRKFLWSTLGKIYYLGISSFGTFYWALAWCVKESVFLLKARKEEIRPRHWLALFLFLAVMAQVLIGSIYMYDSDKIDELVYGRYNELFMPVMVMVGIMVMSGSRFLIRITILIGTALGGVTYLLLHAIDEGNMSGIRGYHVPGISYLLPESNIDVSVFFRNTWLLGFGLVLLVCVFVCLGRWRASTWWMYAGILVIEVAAGLQISSHYTYEANNSNYEHQKIVDLLQDVRGETEGIIYLDEGHDPFVDIVQMQIPEETIHVITEEELPSIDGGNYVVITDAETGQDEVLMEIFEKKTTINSLRVYYNL